MAKLLRSEELPHDVEGAEDVLERHKEIKTEIANKQENFEALQALGRRVVPSAKDPEQIQESVKQLSQEMSELNELWEKKNKQLTQSSELQVSEREREETWKAKIKEQL